MMFKITLAIFLFTSSYAAKLLDLETSRPKSAYSLGFYPTAVAQATKCVCYPSYTTKKEIPVRPIPSAVCSNPNGGFAVVYWSIQKLFSVFDNDGNHVKDIALPPTSERILDCIYTNNQMLLTDYPQQKIYKYTLDGEYAGVFASGFSFTRMALGGNHLYVGIHVDKRIHIYSLSDGSQERIFPTTGYPRGMGFDSKEELVVSMWESNQIEIFDKDGKSLGTKTLQGLNDPDGLDVDGAGNIFIANRKHRVGVSTVTIYSPSFELVNTINGFTNALDVQVCKQPDQLIVADYGANDVDIYR